MTDYGNGPGPSGPEQFHRRRYMALWKISADHQQRAARLDDEGFDARIGKDRRARHERYVVTAA